MESAIVAMRDNDVDIIRLPDYFAWNFDYEIAWFGSINAYHKTSILYILGHRGQRTRPIVYSSIRPVSVDWAKIWTRILKLVF